MNFDREDLRDELVVALVASRELPQHDDAALVAITLDQLEARAKQRSRPARYEHRVADGLLGALELVAGLLAGTVGFGGLAYVRQQFDAANAIGALEADPAHVQYVVVWGTPAAPTIALLLIGLVGGAIIHTVARWRAAIGLLWVCTILPFGYGGTTISQLGSHLAPLIFIHYLPGGAIPALAATTGALAVLTSVAALVRSRMSSARRGSDISSKVGRRPTTAVAQALGRCAHRAPL